MLFNQCICTYFNVGTRWKLANILPWVFWLKPTLFVYYFFWTILPSALSPLGDCLPCFVAQPWPIEPYAEDHERVSATGVCRIMWVGFFVSRFLNEEYNQVYMEDIVSSLLGHPGSCYLNTNKYFWLWTINTLFLWQQDYYYSGTPIIE